MPGFLVHVGAAVQCPHGGVVTEIPVTPRVWLSGLPVATLADQYPIAGCAFTLPPPHPCVRAQWLAPAIRVKASLKPVVLQTSVGACVAADQAPQGPPIVTSTQPRVIGT